jgi:hypothetical protein
MTAGLWSGSMQGVASAGVLVFDSDTDVLSARRGTVLTLHFVRQIVMFVNYFVRTFFLEDFWTASNLLK